MSETKRSAIDELRHIVQWLNNERESLVQELPSINAVVAFCAVLDKYDVESWDDVLDGIAEGEDPDPASRFVRGHCLPESWTYGINNAVFASQEPSK